MDGQQADGPISDTRGRIDASRLILGGAGRAVSRGARSVSAVSDEVEEDIDEALYDELAMIAPSRHIARLAPKIRTQDHV